MSPAATFSVPRGLGFLGGHVLRVAADPASPALLVEARRARARTWSRVSLVRIRDEYPPDAPVWAWLREAGVRRPPPSGTRGYHGTEETRSRPAFTVRLLPRVRERLERIAEKRRLPVNRALEALVDETAL